jgi:hypothetical protein
MDIQTRLGWGATALFTLVSVTQPLVSWYISYTIMILCAAIAAWGFWPLIKIINVMGWPFLIGFITSELATAKLYGKMRGTVIAKVAEREAKTPDDIQNWYAQWMVNRGINIYGKKPPSNVLELIPKHIIKEELYFEGGARRLMNRCYTNRVVFDALSVKRLDIFRQRNALLGKKKREWQ